MIGHVIDKLVACGRHVLSSVTCWVVQFSFPPRMLEASIAYQRESGSLPGRGSVLCCYIPGAKPPVRATGPLRAWATVQRKVAVCKDLRALLVQIIFKTTRAQGGEGAYTTSQSW